MTIILRLRPSENKSTGEDERADFVYLPASHPRRRQRLYCRFLSWNDSSVLNSE